MVNTSDITVNMSQVFLKPTLSMNIVANCGPKNDPIPKAKLNIPDAISFTFGCFVPSLLYELSNISGHDGIIENATMNPFTPKPTIIIHSLSGYDRK